MLRRYYLDIETTSEGRPTPENLDNPIISISTWDSFDRIHRSFLWRDDLTYGENETIVEYAGDELGVEVLTAQNERTMLRRFIKDVENRDPDIILGWNVEDFDLAYLIGRMKEVREPYGRLSPIGRTSAYRERTWWRCRIKGRLILDLQRAYSYLHITSLRSRRLDYVATIELGHGKVGSPTKVSEMWENDLEGLIRYNMTDVLLTRDIDEKCQICQHFKEASRIAGCDLRSVYWKSSLFDAFAMSHSGDVILPTKEESTGLEKYAGATIIPPRSKGVIRNVYVYDLSRMYPNVIISGNMSPETIAPESFEEGGTIDINLDGRSISFRKDREGFIPRILRKMFGMRDDIERKRNEHKLGTRDYERLSRRRQVIKDQINSVYGMLAFRKSRFFLPEIRRAKLIPETVAFIGRELLEWSKGRVENSGYRVEYADTDSMHVTGLTSPEEGTDVERMINETYDRFSEQFNMDKHHFEIELEKIYSNMFFKKGVKKRYAGQVIWLDGDWVERPITEIIGFEFRRGDSAILTADIQERMFQMVLRGRGREEVMDWIKGLVRKFLDREFDPMEISIPKGWTRPTDSYKVIPIHVRGALYSNKHLGTNFDVGSKPRYLYVSGTGRKPRTDVICIDEDTEIPHDFSIDYEKMLDKVIFKKIEMLDEALGWNIIPEIKERISPQIKLEEFL